jgi:hypothetical protein
VTGSTATRLFLLASGGTLAGIRVIAAPAQEGLRPPHDPLPIYLWQRQISWAVLVVLAVLAALWFLKRSRRKQPTPTTFPPAVLARQQLESLRGLPENEQVASQVSGIIRAYLRVRYLLPHNEFTTPELRAKLADHPQCGADLAKTVAEFLHACDERKFGPLTENPPKDLADQAIAILDRTTPGQYQRSVAAAQTEKPA